MSTWAVIPAAGSGQRMGGGTAKQFLPLNGVAVLARALALFQGCERVAGIVLVGDEACGDVARPFSKVAHVVAGGEDRQESVRRGLLALPPEADIVCVHDAVRPLLPPSLLDGILQAAEREPALVMAVPVKDTIKVVEGGRIKATPDRSSLWAAQTPQVFHRALLERAYREAGTARTTDDAGLVERLGVPVAIYPGSPENIKLTTPEDMTLAEVILRRRFEVATGTRAGVGYDAHRLVEGRRLVLGGVEIPFERGLLGHSDADVVLHAVMDALLGAAGLPDIGHHFPDTDPAYRGADSLQLLGRVVGLLREHGYAPGNVDVSIIAERPKLAPHVHAMQQRMAAVLGIHPDRIGIKATTNEGLGLIGAGEGIAAHAVATIIPLIRSE